MTGGTEGQGLLAVGFTLRVDHGDKVTERTVIERRPAHVVTVSRWISGTPYRWQGQRPHNFRWVCTHEEWVAHVRLNPTHK